jgi:ABC-type uncharacterized transport system substrate-binding protein
MMPNAMKSFLTTAALAMSALFAPAAWAHPHVWVTYEVTVTAADGKITGIEHIWSFDDMYTTMAIEGLDKNGDGVYSREELAELAQTNMDGMKDFDYFTFAKAGSKPLAFAEPQDYWLEHDGKILKLHFRLPLKEPVAAASAEPVTFQVYDPSFFIAFEPEQTNAVKLAPSAPKGCAAAFREAAADKDLTDLNNAFAQVGGTSGTGSWGKVIAVTCPHS